MADFAEGIGAAIEGGLAAKTVEPDDGEGRIKADEETECANCGAPLSGPYCHQCGQKARVHRTITAILHDLIHGVLHLDGKLSHTLPLLVFKPGRLTRRYIDGERAKFVSPMSMFLFGVFAMFAVFQMVGLTAPTDLDFGSTASALREKGEAEIAELKESIEQLPADDPARLEQEQEIEAIERILNGSGESDASNGVLRLGENGGVVTMEPTGIDWIDKGIFKKWNDNPGLMLYKMQANGYKFSWLLIPLSIPFVWAVFLWKRRFKAYDHAIFVTYSLSFMSLLFITVSLLAVTPIVGSGWPFALLFLGAPLHLYKHLRYTYGLSRFSTIWRFAFLMFSMIFILLMFGNTLLVLGAF